MHPQTLTMSPAAPLQNPENPPIDPSHPYSHPLQVQK